MQIIYIDTLFLLNAIIDYLLLLSSAKVAGEPLVRWRFALGAVLGGLYAVGIFVFPFLQSLFYKIILGLLIVLVAFGQSRRLLRQGLIFLALSFAFAGGILGISLFGGQGLTFQEGVFYSSMDLKMVFLSAAFCYMLVTVLFRNFARHSRLTGEIRSVTISLADKEIPLTALVDTGNTLCDPVTGTAVVVVEGQRLSPFFREEVSGSDLLQPTNFLEQRTELAGRMRLLPYQVVGMQGLLLVVKVDEIKVDGVLVKENLVGMSATSLSDGGNYQALLPSQ